MEDQVKVTPHGTPSTPSDSQQQDARLSATETVASAKPVSAKPRKRRRTYSLEFKLGVLDAYKHDEECKRNQRGIARKFGINRRQVQRWIADEEKLRKKHRAAVIINTYLPETVNKSAGQPDLSADIEIGVNKENALPSGLEKVKETDEINSVEEETSGCDLKTNDVESTKLMNTEENEEVGAEHTDDEDIDVLDLATCNKDANNRRLTNEEEIYNMPLEVRKQLALEEFRRSITWHSLEAAIAQKYHFSVAQLRSWLIGEQHDSRNNNAFSGVLPTDTISQSEMCVVPYNARGSLVAADERRNDTETVAQNEGTITLRPLGYNETIVTEHRVTPQNLSYVPSFYAGGPFVTAESRRMQSEATARHYVPVSANVQGEPYGGYYYSDRVFAATEARRHDAQSTARYYVANPAYGGLQGQIHVTTRAENESFATNYPTGGFVVASEGVRQTAEVMAQHYGTTPPFVSLQDPSVPQNTLVAGQTVVETITESTHSASPYSTTHVHSTTQTVRETNVVQYTAHHPMN